METQNTNPFTNTRLMLAGIVFGVLGMLLSFWVIDDKIQQATGGTKEVCVMSKDLGITEKLTKAHVRYVSVPARFVEAANKIITRSNLGNYMDRKPKRNLLAGEPISSGEFYLTGQTGESVKRRAGSELLALRINNDTNPGQGVGRGSIVIVWATVAVGDGPESWISLPLLEKTRVVLINGGFKKDDRVRQVSLELGASSVQFMKFMERYIRGDLTVTVQGDEAAYAKLGHEVPASTRTELIKAGIKLPAGLRSSDR